jgi:hypothetical protein
MNEHSTWSAGYIWPSESQIVHLHGLYVTLMRWPSHGLAECVSQYCVTRIPFYLKPAYRNHDTVTVYTDFCYACPP